MSLAFSPERSVEQHACAECVSPFRLVRGELTLSGEPHAVFVAGCHHHGGRRDVLIDVILGWTTAEDDHVTFGCRVGPTTDGDGPLATLVDAAREYGDDPEWGRKLTADDAAADPRLNDFWAAVDYVLVHDPTVRPHVYGID